MPNIGETIDKYKVLSALGTGGMGQVFLAEDLLLGRKTALKFISPGAGADPEVRNRFFREARAASSLNHPNICTIYEITDRPDEPYIAMEFAEGETLAALIRRRRRSSWQAVELAIQIAEALDEAHRKGVIHRDIKPANIIVDSRGRVKVLDFGLAKRIDIASLEDQSQFETSPGVVLGTMSYMSPEQARGMPVDHRSDIWSLGVCLYEMLTGRSPFAGESHADTLAAVLRSEPLPPSILAEGVPDALDSLVLACVRKRVEERVPTASEIIRQLRVISSRMTKQPAAPGPNDVEPLGDEPTEIIERAPETEMDAGPGQPEMPVAWRAPNNLTSDHRKIIGRENEIAIVAGMLLDPEIRLVTLTGIGGTGKTTLARAVARKLLDSFPDGVFFVELAAVARPELVIPSIAQVLGIKDEGGRLIDEDLRDHLYGKRMLLVIDNFEQVVDAAPFVAELLDSAAGMKWLVTSREVLRLTAENEFQVPSLGLPVSKDSAFDDLSKSDAIILFTERARSVRPSFELTEGNIADIAAICNRLDGLPLAIELAAARVKVLSPKAILVKIEQSLDLLTGGARDRPERQRTMRGAVSWSYDLLDEPERAAFRKLAVFSGGFRLEAAEAVCGERPDGNPDLFQLITSLIDKSLLVRREATDGEPRFRMLEVVRDLALEILAAAGEDTGARRKHSEYFVSLGEMAEPRLQSADSAVWLARLEEDHDNIRAAMQWSLENDPFLAVRLAVSVRNFWLVHSHLREGLEWLRAAAGLGAVPDHELQFKLLNGLGLAARFCGDLITARNAYERGLEVGREAGNRPGTALSNRGLGLVAMQQGDLASAHRYFDAGLAISRELGHKYGIAMSLAFLGDLARTEGRFADSLEPFSEAVNLFRELENKAATSDVLNNLGAALVCMGEPTSAAPYFREALETANRMSNRITTSHSLDGFAAIAVVNDEPLRAAELFGAAEKLRESIGYKIEPAEDGFRKRFFTRLQTAMADDELKIGLKEGREMKLDDVISQALAVSDNVAAADAN